MYSGRGYIPSEIKDTNDKILIRAVIDNTIKSLQRKIEKNGSYIFHGAYLLISTK